MGKLGIGRLLVAGGAGFLGSAFVRDRLRADSEVAITVLDALRRPTAEEGLADLRDDRRFALVRGDVGDRPLVEQLASNVDAIVSFATDEFVGRDPDAASVVRTDVAGTATLLQAARKFRHQRFLLVSTMEVYGPLKAAPSREEDALAPRTVPAAARAAAELFTRAFNGRQGVPVLVTRSATAYGPRQPLDQPVARMITSALQGLPVPLEGDGSALRDYLFVDDQVGAIARVLWKGEPGTVYNVGAGAQLSSRDLAETILRLCGQPASLKRAAGDGPGWSYGMETRRMRPLGWEPRTTLSDGLRLTVDWYRKNGGWWRPAAAA